MRFTDHKLLTDENISPRVVTFLRGNGFDVLDVKETGMNGTPDRILLERAFNEQRFVVTHDSDFGTLAINNGQPCYGVLYFRFALPAAANVITALTTLIAMNPEISTNSLVVIDETRIRVRTL